MRLNIYRAHTLYHFRQHQALRRRQVKLISSRRNVYGYYREREEKLYGERRSRRNRAAAMPLLAQFRVEAVAVSRPQGISLTNRAESQSFFTLP